MKITMNPIVKSLIISDFLLNSAWGFLSPIFALFLAQNISGGDVKQAAKVAGFAALFYWITKSALQLPIAKQLDKNHGDIDDFWSLVIGLVIASIIPIGYLFSYHAWHIYALEIIHAIGLAMIIPAWYAIFTRHIDKGREAFEWGLDSTSLGFGVGITGAVGGIVAAFFGLSAIFIFTTAINLVSAIFLLVIRKKITLQTSIAHTEAQRI
jgi:hypothetical protein